MSERNELNEYEVNKDIRAFTEECTRLMTEVQNLRDREFHTRKYVKELEAAIRAHKEQFPDEPLTGDRKLWRVLK